MKEEADHMVNHDICPENKKQKGEITLRLYIYTHKYIHVHTICVFFVKEVTEQAYHVVDDHICPDNNKEQKGEITLRLYIYTPKYIHVYIICVYIYV